MAGRAFRVPSIYELYYNDGGQTQEPSPGLRPETVWSGEVEFTQANIGTLRVRLGAGGQVSVCSTSGALSHLPACPPPAP